MPSTLPDSSALEAAILEDTKPSRLSRVQDNVRDLFRGSVFGSGSSTPKASPVTAARPAEANDPNDGILPASTYQPDEDERRNANETWTYPKPLFGRWPRYGENEPSSSTTVTTSPVTQERQPEPVPGVLFSSPTYDQDTPAYNSRDTTTPQHPDLSDQSHVAFLREKAAKRQRHAWKRSKHSSNPKHSKATRAQIPVLIATTLLLTALLAAYLTKATQDHLHPLIHVAFILSILLLTAILLHTSLRQCVMGKTLSPPSKIWLPRSRNNPPAQTQTQELQPLPQNDPYPTPETPNPPPPAYGKWRGSIRVSPQILDSHCRRPNPTNPSNSSNAFTPLPPSAPHLQPPSYTPSPLPNSAITDLRAQSPELARLPLASRERVLALVAAEVAAGRPVPVVEAENLGVGERGLVRVVVRGWREGGGVWEVGF